MLENKEGQNVPQVVFPTRKEHEWVNIDSNDIFKGRTVIVFSLPGAFTPTCSSTHVPRYNQLAASFKQHGVDEIVCVSVNDTFVMNHWKEEQEAHDVTFLADGNGDFTRGMGMLVSKSDLGFGDRSWRYSMLVKDGVIVKMFIEDEGVAGDPFDVSDADTMLKFIAPSAEAPRNVTIFTRRGCPFCVKAKGLLKDAGLDYDELVLNEDFRESTIRAISGETSVPQIFIDGARIGGSEALEQYLNIDAGKAA